MDLAADMYQENIMDHYRKPHNKGTLPKAQIKRVGQNPLCGDEVEITISLDKENKRVKDVRFKGTGCAISQAAASMLTERIKGLTLDEVKVLTRDDVVDMLGIPVSATRTKCAVLSLVVVKHGIEEFEGRTPKKTTTEDVPGEGA